MGKLTGIIDEPVSRGGDGTDCHVVHPLQCGEVNLDYEPSIFTGE